MTKIGIMRLIKSLNGEPVTAGEILSQFPKRRWKTIKSEIDDLRRANELKRIKIKGKDHYVLGGDKKGN